MDNSFVKLYRSLLDWEWWDDKNTTRLFMTLLLSVNWKEKQWHGMTIKAGSMFTSLESLAKKSGLTLSQTRTSLNKLKMTGEITSTIARKGQLVTIENWAKFQGGTEKIACKMTCNNTGTSQDNRKQVATTKERKERKESKKDIYIGLSDNLVKALKDFESMRNRIKAPLNTDRSKQMLLTKLTKLAGDDDDLKVAILEQSIFNNWKGVYELKDDNRRSTTERTGVCGASGTETARTAEAGKAVWKRFHTVEEVLSGSE